MLGATLSMTMARLKRFIAPYYIINFLMICIYQLIRLEGAPREIESRSMLLVLTVLVIRSRRHPSVDATLATFFTYAKAAICYMLWTERPALFWWYGACVLLAFFFLQQPQYTGPQNIVMMNPVDFETKVLGPAGYPVLKNGTSSSAAASGNAKKARKVARRAGDAGETTYVVCFYATWNSTAVQSAPLFAELSLMYGDDLVFAKVDVGRFPDVATRLDIRTGATDADLPVFIVFRGGKVVARYPNFHPRRPATYNSDLLVKELQLEEMVASARAAR